MEKEVREQLQEYFNKSSKYDFDTVIASVPETLEDIKISIFTSEYKKWRREFTLKTKIGCYLTKEQFCDLKAEYCKKKDLSAELVMKILDLYLDGLTFTEIAKQVGIARHRIYNLVCEAKGKCENLSRVG